MRLADYGSVLLRRSWVIILLMLAASITAYVVSSQQTPVYRATQNVLIQPSRSDFGLTEASRNLLEPAVVYLDSSFIAQRIIEELRLDMHPQTLMERVNIASDNLRYVVQIDVDLQDPEVAAQVATAWGEEFVEYRNQENQRNRREDRVTALLPDNPTVRQIEPQPAILAAAAAILGLIIGTLLVFGLEFIESGFIRRRDDLERTLQMPVLATIPQVDER